jgi:ribosome maturation factor RimP
MGSSVCPFFLLVSLSALISTTPSMDALTPVSPSFDALTAKTVAGLGFDLVDVERAGRGLLRVTIDRLDGSFVTVDDCEAVTRQLQYVLDVEGVAYERLEVSSPGLDRPLRTEAHFQRFVGEWVDITLKAAMGQGQGNRRKFRGVLAEGSVPGSWQISWSDDDSIVRGETRQDAAVKGKPRKAGPRVEQVLGFRLDELREARLVAVVNFKGRSEGRAALCARN